MTATTSKKSSQHIYDYAVIGSGLSGLCLANALIKVSQNVLLLDGGDTYGGFNRSIQTPVGLMNNGLRFMPNSDLAQKSIAFLEMLLTHSLSPEVTEETPVTYDASGIKPFVGFGDQPPAFYDELAYFTKQESLKLKLEPHEWSQILFNNFTGEFSPKSYVTKIHSENGLVTHLTINGQKKVQAQNVIYCGPVKSLKTLLPEGALSQRALGKLAKNQYWTAVCLDLLHDKVVTTNPALHVLNGTTQDDLGPCVGRFLQEYSQWMTFVDAEESEDTEVIGAALKKMKRQIKRAYPESLENLKYERILVVPDYAGNGDLRLSANQTLPSLPNFWIASATLSPQKNILGALAQAELVTSALGCHPLGSQIETIDRAASEETLETSEELAQDLEA